MLDQNTDRTWWMIGAVIVGALLVGAAKLAFPHIFEEVMSFFTGQLGEGSELGGWTPGGS